MKKKTVKKAVKKRETQEQMMRRVLKDANHTNVSNCTFAGVQFSEAATEAITTIAEGLVENAKALGQLAYVLKASNVEIDTMMKIEQK